MLPRHYTDYVEVTVRWQSLHLPGQHPPEKDFHTLRLLMTGMTLLHDCMLCTNTKI